MAVVQNRKGSYRILFLHEKKRYAFTLGRVSQQEAESKASAVDYLLMRIKQGYVTVPAGIDLVTFVQHDGKPPEPVPEPTEGAATGSLPQDRLTLAKLRDDYLRVHRNGTLEESTLATIEMHFRHLASTLGESFEVPTLGLADLQKHVDMRRATAKGTRGRKLSASTIKAELVTLRTAWNWAAASGVVSGRFPMGRGLRLPKTDEKPPFQTFEEIERKVKAGGLRPDEIDDLWDCLFLTALEVAEFLGHVRLQASQPWVYPAVALAAHTGARRSEVLRLRVQDVDLDAGNVTIHEKKKARGKRTTRRVPLSDFLAGVLREWLTERPAGPTLFCQAAKVVRSKTKRSAPTAVSRDEAHDHFQRTLARSKWEVLRGWHVLRHSFVSNCAAQAVDQRLIDDWVGHTTEEMRKRYRHLVPSTERAAIQSVFG